MQDKAKPPQVNPLRRPVLAPADINAIRAVNKGMASPEQQRRAIRVIVEDFCETYGMSFRLGGDGQRMTDFALGKQHVGQGIVWAINSAPVKESIEELSIEAEPNEDEFDENAE